MMFFAYVGMVLAVGVVVGLWTHMEEHGGDIIFPKKLKVKVKTGFLFQIYTCVLAAGLSTLMDVVALDMANFGVVTIHSVLAAFAGKGFILMQTRKFEKMQDTTLEEIETKMKSPVSSKKDVKRTGTE